MKKLNQITLVASILFVVVSTQIFFSCNKNIEEPKFINVDQTNLKIETNGQTVVFNITSNSSWSILVSPLSDITIDKKSGSGNSTIILTVNKNETFSTKKWTLTIKSENESKIVSIEQKSKQLLFVSKSGNDTNNGLSWQQAKKNLQAALDIAEDGSTIWIASGIYYPTKEKTVGDPRSKSFIVNKNNVSIYGGFKGNETISTERSNSDFDNNSSIDYWEFTNETVLSGDIDGVKDVWEYDEKNSSILWNVLNNDNNAYQLFSTYDINNSTLSLIDGVTLTNANANGFTSKQNAISGDITIDKVQNCIIKNNCSDKTLEKNIKMFNNNLIEGNISKESIFDNVIEFNGCLIRSNTSYAYWTISCGTLGRSLSNCIIYNNMNMTIYFNVYNSLIFNNNGLCVYEPTNKVTFANNNSHVFDYFSSVIHSNDIVWVLGGKINVKDLFGEIYYKFSNSALINTFSPKYAENNISLSVDNNGIDTKVNYPQFKNPSTFIGCAQNKSDLEKLYQCNWELLSTSSCIKYGYKK